MNPIFIEQFGDEGLERSLDKIEKELLEKMENFNKQFETSIQPDNGFYGISEIVKPDGIVEKLAEHRFVPKEGKPSCGIFNPTIGIKR